MWTIAFLQLFCHNDGDYRIKDNPVKINYAYLLKCASLGK